MRASSSRTPSRKEESERYTATLRRRCIARAQEARQAVLSRQRGISDGLDASAVARDIISAELREASCAGWARRGPRQDGEPDPHADLDFEAYAELLAATEQSLLAELREDVASLDGPGGEEYEAFLDWAAQGDEARLREAADEADGGGASVLCPLCERGALLHTADGWVVCNRGAAGDCALRLWAEGHPAPVELLRERMATLLSQHGLACRGRARCRLPTEFEATGRLLMSCETCGSNVVVV